MDEIQSSLTFNQAKELADRAIQDVKNGIVSAGYALQAIRRDRLWEPEGYESFDDFMELCYHKDKSWASNCIRVYEQFGELAGPEQVPRLQERYQEYSANGLIEMLSMSAEMREQVTADMPVREIRELKREAKKVVTSQPEEEQLPGQMDITDFLDDPEEEQEPEKIAFLPEVKASGSFILATEDLAEEDLNEEQAADRQQENGCPPGISSCIRQNWGTNEKDQEEGRKECAACWKHWKALRKTTQVEPLQEEEDGTQEKAENTEEYSWPKTCITGWSKSGNCVCCEYGGVRCCKDCEEDCNCRCGWIPEEESVQETKEPDAEAEIICKPTAKTLLEEYKGEWEALQAAFEDTPEEEQPPAVENTRIILQALQLLVEQERQEEAEPEEQPELPPMKNNDQRKEWLRNYQSWGLWYEDEHIGVRYYKYEFDNGARLIAEEYPAAGKRDFTAYYLHLIGGPEPPKHSSYGCPKWNRHERYTKHPDSETELVEFLKVVQR
jgi:hypothetical protein